MVSAARLWMYQAAGGHAHDYSCKKMLETLINGFIGGLYPSLIPWKTRARPYFQLWDVPVKLAIFKVPQSLFWTYFDALERLAGDRCPSSLLAKDLWLVLSLSLQGLSTRMPTQRCSAWPCRTAAWPTWGGWTKLFRTTDASRPRPGPLEDPQPSRRRLSSADLDRSGDHNQSHKWFWQRWCSESCSLNPLM